MDMINEEDLRRLLAKSVRGILSSIDLQECYRLHEIAEKYDLLDRWAAIHREEKLRAAQEINPFFIDL